MATTDEIRHRVERADADRSAKRSAAAQQVGELAQRRAAIAEQLGDIERELGDVLAAARDVIDVDELLPTTPATAGPDPSGVAPAGHRLESVHGNGVSAGHALPASVGSKDVRPDRFLSRVRAVCSTEAFAVLGIWVRRCWAGEEATRWMAGWMTPRLSP
jgi:hypothetical protein